MRQELIKSDEEYQAALERRRRLMEAELHHLAHPLADPWAQGGVLEGERYARSIAEAELAEYEGLRSGTITWATLAGLGDLPELLVRARIAAGLTRADLALRLGLAESAIVAWEEGGYLEAPLRDLIVAAEAIGLRLRGIGDFASAPRREVAVAGSTAQEERQGVAARL
jgi:HTH-type transcriptional regulator/antitoxin HigA